LLFPRQETRPIEVLGGSVVSVASGTIHRELILALGDSA
jgi:hypothetical protein